MTDTPFLDLSPRWRLAADNLQWIIQRRRGEKWDSVSFVATRRDILFRALRELDAEVTPAALDALDDLPLTFKEWVDSHTGSATRKQFKTAHSANSGVSPTTSQEAA